MKKSSFILISILLFCGSLLAQTEERVVCPNLHVAGSAPTASAGDMLTFTVQIDTFGKEYKLQYNWTLERVHKSPGQDHPIEIISGQGTPTITVRQVDGGITATIEIRGFPQNCYQVASETTFIDPPPTKIADASGSSRSPDCPKISISGPSGVPNPGESISFFAQVDTGGKDLKIEYVWSVSAGEIILGQGTPTITVRAPDDSVTATVEVKGFPEGCPNMTSESLGCGLRIPQAELIESLRGPVTAKDKTQFEKINKVMLDDPSARYMFFVAGKDVKQLRANKDAIFKYLLTRDIDPPRITFVDLPANSEVTQFWRVPSGANDPTIDGLTIRP